MTKNCYAYVGSFSYTGSEGIHICSLDRESGSLTYLKTVFPEIHTNCVTVSGNVLYATDGKAGDPEKDPDAGGGRVYAFRIDPDTGDLSLLHKRDTYCVNPSYVTIDPTGKYTDFSSAGTAQSGGRSFACMDCALLLSDFAFGKGHFWNPTLFPK